MSCGDDAGGFPLLRSYAYELYLIGKEQDEGSKRQQAVFKLAKRSFDQGDGARLTTGMPLCTLGPGPEPCKDSGGSRLATERLKRLLETLTSFHAMIALVVLGTRPGQRQN